MNYRRLGSSGLKVSELSFGSWVTYGNQLSGEPARDCMAAALRRGRQLLRQRRGLRARAVRNVMGEALRKLGWRRSSYIVSTKFFWGIARRPQREEHAEPQVPDAGDRRVARAPGARLRRSRLLPPRRPDTPIEETVRAMHDMIVAGKALYWGTSEWSAAEIMAAWQIAERHHLHKPVMEQPQYNLLHRDRVEKEYARLYSDIGLGTTIWSPLASGLLTGKYNDGIPPDSRGTVKGYEWLAERLTDAAKIAVVRRLGADRRRPGLHAGAAVARVVPQEPARVDRHHRREPPGAGGREHEGARGRPAARRRRHGAHRCRARRMTARATTAPASKCATPPSSP